MNKSILIISHTKQDRQLFTDLLTPHGYHIEWKFLDQAMNSMPPQEYYTAIIMDYDMDNLQVTTFIRHLQTHRSKACLILYGTQPDPERLSNILQEGVYAFVERHLIPMRIVDTLMGGLENRKAFIRILKMMDDLTHVNTQLEQEKKALKRKNRELNFINRLSSKTAYDLHWDEIMPRILDAGLEDVMDFSLFSILYRIGDSWHLTFYAPKTVISMADITQLKKSASDILLTFTNEKIPAEDIICTHAPGETDQQSTGTIPLPSGDSHVFPLNTGGNLLGMLCVTPQNPDTKAGDMTELVSTMSNILAMSLNNAQKFNRLKERSVMDGLTGLYNHKRFKEILRSEYERTCRYQTPLSLVMLDGDKFKEINDTYGHLAGDMVLQELAGCLKRSVRATDVVARYGGDEFAILLPETDMKMAQVLTRRIEQTVAQHHFEWKTKKIKVEVSHGIATAKLNSHGNPRKKEHRPHCEQDLIHQADMNLYRMKQARG